MSSIRWHFPKGTVESTAPKAYGDDTLCMGGRERAWMGALIDDIALAVVKRMTPWAKRDQVPADFPHDNLALFPWQLNTAATVGSRALRLAVQIHGRCETCTVINRDAMTEVADALEEGLKTGVFREEAQGYDPVGAIIETLRKKPAWCQWSYSVTDGHGNVRRHRAEGNVLEKGRLDDPAPFNDGKTFLNTPFEEWVWF